jgi:S1-C subfamily serine protease
MQAVTFPAMSRRLRWLLCALSLALISPRAFAQSPLQELLNDTSLAGRWIYKDVDTATAEARRTGKPLLVLFRCVPCQCAAELDRQITRGGVALDQLLDRFVCVRVVQMNGVDVRRFQFDRDLSLAALFLNADGTVYGRYGTRAVQQRTALTHISLASFLRAMERVLDLHAAFPANRAQFAAKQGAVNPPLLADTMPFMRPFPGRQAVQNCIHCHMVGEAELTARTRAGTLTASDIWSFPLPENLGLRLDVDDGLLIKTVRADSPAAQLSLQPGDQLVALGGQPLISQADIQWALHHAPMVVNLPVEFRRGGQLLTRTFELGGNWKQSDMPWRESLNGVRPGLVLQTVSSGERQRQGLPADGMALGVRYVTSAPLRGRIGTSDVIVAANDRTDFKTESEFLTWLRLSQPPLKNVRLKLMRKGETREMDLPLEVEK